MSGTEALMFSLLLVPYAAMVWATRPLRKRRHGR